MRDTVNVLRQGVPVVALIHEPFEKLAALQAIQLGVRDAPLLAYAQDIPSRDPQELTAQKAREVVGRVEASLLSHMG